MAITLDQARAAYAAQASLRSPHTLQAYLRAIDLFILSLDDRHFSMRLPLHQHIQISASELDLGLIGQEDSKILLYFAKWLQTPDESDSKRPYAVSTIELRLAGLQHWMEFLRQKTWLAEDFSLDEAISAVRSFLQEVDTPLPTQPSVIDYDLAEFLVYYQGQQPSRNIQRNPLQLARWELTRLRNHALIQMLAETGGQVSAILSLNVADVQSEQVPLKIDLTGKNEHSYTIILEAALPALREYLAKRTIDDSQKSPIFVSHDAKYDGQRMSRVIAWRIIQRAAKAVQLPELSPHDLRHWRAKQLIQGGLSAEGLQAFLGHRTLNTIYAYYGEWLGRE